ncbi:lipase family alpha/beta hydrolase [Haliea sp. E17]|uniref:lipase family alpha/beta hydrolase n=1 Tax=Haliea sp. E17 TaxID=3401576 RepID=UPI003AACBC1A
MSTPRHAHAPPGLLKVLMELRAVPECYIGFSSLPFARCMPRGDGHPVLVLPGFMADKASTLHLRWLVAMLGYKVYDWKQGVNVGPVGHMEKVIIRRIDEITQRNGRKPTLLGWSLGGVYARVLAHEVPDKLRSVITMGSPVRFPHRSTADRLYQRMSGQLEHPEFLQTIASPPAVPATAIYSRLDGIVNWQACLTDESAQAENIRVYGSHLGLGYNPNVFFIVADRLAQPEGEWRRFSYSGAYWRTLSRKFGFA